MTPTSTRPVATAAALVGAAVLSGCAASRALAPLERGQHAIYADLGGPLVEFGGASVPVPFANVGWGYGLDGKSNVHAAINPSSPALIRVYGVNAGYSRELLPASGAKPRLMLDTTAYAFWGDNRPGAPEGGFRWFQDLSAVATWDLPTTKPAPHRLYAGLDLFLQPAPTFHAYPVPLVGGELRLGRNVGLQLETAWWGITRDTLDAVPVWRAPGNQGAIATRIGLNVYLPGKHHE
jgi:hypothetical protein